MQTSYNLDGHESWVHKRQSSYSPAKNGHGDVVEAPEKIRTEHIPLLRNFMQSKFSSLLALAKPSTYDEAILNWLHDVSKSPWIAFHGTVQTLEPVELPAHRLEITTLFQSEEVSRFVPYLSPHSGQWYCILTSPCNCINLLILPVQVSFCCLPGRSHVLHQVGLERQSFWLCYNRNVCNTIWSLDVIVLNRIPSLLKL